MAGLLGAVLRVRSWAAIISRRSGSREWGAWDQPSAIGVLQPLLIMAANAGEF
jgi:hypothetical protein